MLVCGTHCVHLLSSCGRQFNNVTLSNMELDVNYIRVTCNHRMIFGECAYLGTRSSPCQLNCDSCVLFSTQALKQFFPITNEGFPLIKQILNSFGAAHDRKKNCKNF